MSFHYKHARPAIAVDCVVFGFSGGDLKILLIQRGLEPFQGCWALPGGFVDIEESLEEAAHRELVEETGVEKIFLEQLYTFSRPDRDPRERVISVAYYALIDMASQSLKADSDATEAQWIPLDEVPALAFDHREILDTALARLRGKVSYQPVGFELLPEKFTLTQLQQLYQVILGKALDKRNFRKKLLKMGVLEDLNERQQNVPHRAARLYRFDRQRYRELEVKGFMFDL